MPAWKITAAQQADLPALLALLSDSGLPPDGLAEHLDSAITARAAGDIIGSAALEIYGTSALLRSLAVAPAWRGQGLGRALTQAALQNAQASGVRQIYLLTTTAEQYFPLFGFTPIPRDAVAPEVQVSAEFTGACPLSAVVLTRQI